MTWVTSYRSMQLALGLMALVAAIDSPGIQAQPATVVSDVRFIPPPPPDLGAPSGRRRGGANRCSQCNPDLQVMALVPGDDRERSPLTLTVAERPTFWFYISHALKSELSGEFVVQNAANEYVYRTTFTTPGTSEGMVSIVLPQTTAPLSVGKQYHWTVLIYSDPQASSGYVAVDGLVQRMVPNPQLLNQLKQATPRERTALYATHGIWCEALTNLAELRRQNPQDAMLSADWVSLLHSVGLDDIAAKLRTESKNARL